MAATPPSLKHELLALLQPVEGFEALPSKVAGGTALFFKGKEFAHFHHDNEIDLRLTKTVIRQLGLVHPTRSAFHPARSPSSQWIEVRFHTSEEVQHVAALVKKAIAAL
jgi:hypothetical protein